MIDCSSQQSSEVGQLLVQVQDDLHQLKTKLLLGRHASGSQRSAVELSYLEQEISKTEKKVKAKTEEALNHFNKHVTTVSESTSQPKKSEVVVLESTWDMKLGSKTHWSPDSSGDKQLQIVKAQESNLVASEGIQLVGLSPGQSLQHSLNARIIQNPYNSRNREVVNNAYHVQLPLINARQTIKPSGAELVKGRTFSQLAVLPKANRADPSLIPPPFSVEDASHGIISLVDRGLIPPGSQLSLDPPPVRPTTVQIHSPQERVAGGEDVARPRSRLASVPRNVSSSTSLRSLHQTPLPGHASKPKASVSVRLVEMQPSQPEPPPTTPASVAYELRSYRFACQHGRVKENSEEFEAFKKHYYHSSWGSIVTMIRHLEKFLTQYAVPVAFINGDRLVELALQFELEQVPTTSDILSLIVNRDDVVAAIRKPGRVYHGARRQELAAIKIQATYRMHRERARYVDYRRRKWAAGVFAISWIMCVKLAQVKRQLKVLRLKQLDSFRVRSKQLSENWTRLKTSRRTIVHIPSLGFEHHLRQTVAEFDVIQNQQMARLCDLKDPNVDVIYVSPVPVSDEMLQYYNRLVGLAPAVLSGNTDDQADLSSRFKVITVEASKPFQDRRMCLSTLLKYSPRALKRIKAMLHGREAYIVTGVPHVDDVYLSDYLDIPVLCPEPDVAHLYSTKSGAKRVFANAGVTMPPGELDIYSLQQMHEVLAQLIVDNLAVSRWLFKLDHEFDGRGIAFVDIARTLPCYAWCVKESQRYGPDKWRKKWAQEAAYLRIVNELPAVLNDNAQPANVKAYSTWAIYLQAFLSQGGIIEACPPSDSVTSLSVCALIEPGEGVQLVVSGDQIHAESEWSCWGLSVPQSSVDPTLLNDALSKITTSCRARGIVGYITVDFVTFIDPISLKQEVWAVDLDVSYHDMVSMWRLVEFATGGRLEPITHSFVVTPSSKPEKKVRRRVQVETREMPSVVNRCAVFSTRLLHTNLTMVHYSVFFQMCRAHGIGYDIKEKQGTLFMLVDSTRREHLGMLTIGESLQSVLATFAKNLSVIHQEISAPNMQGQTNFKAAITDIQSILGTTEQNAEELVDNKEHT